MLLLNNDAKAAANAAAEYSAAPNRAAEQTKEVMLAQPETEENTHAPLKFTAKEISNMPISFRKLFRIGGLPVHCRKRVRSSSVCYELRCRACGYNISAAGRTIEIAKARFIDRLKKIDADNKRKISAIPTGYKDFCLYYFEKFRKRKVTEMTYRCDLQRCKNHIFPALGDMELSEITPSDCQELLDRITEQGMGKTADEVFSLMNVTFKGAIAHGLIARNPLAIVFHRRHVQEHGKALTREEEARLIASDSPHRLQLITALYTWLRPNEYFTLRREGAMLIARNSKRKGGKIEYKRIPINPMLAPHIGDQTQFDFCILQTLYKHLRRILPGRTLYDLRTTFYTRCRECGVADAARDEMVGHSSGVLADAYTDLSDAYLIREAAKLCYTLPPAPDNA